MLEKPSKKYKVSQKKINKELDNLWSKVVKKLAGYRCEVCGKTENLNSHHIIGRTNRVG